jgi:hypothetical protein
MALSDTQNFLTDLLARYDPNLDLSEGSRAQTELIEPILARIGGDPFDEDIETFIRTRLSQVRSDLAITEVDELTDLLIDPMRILLEPVTREIQLVKLRMSLNNIAALADDEVDALMGNFFEARKAGGYAVGVARAYFAAPQNISVTLVHVAQSRGGLRYLVPRPQAITADQMLLNADGPEYYFDINYVAESRGSEYNIERGEINSIANLPPATRVTNLRRFVDGIQRETSADYVARVQQGSSDKTLTTTPGITAVLTENFPTLRQLFEVGYGDPEMQRDVLRGGSLGAIPSDDALGEYFGLGTVVDDFDADATTNILQGPGNFVTRVAAAGQKPDGWYVTVVYTTAGHLVVRDVAVTQVISETRIRIDHEMPLTLGPGSVTWMLREKKLTISEIPGGITLPDTPAGELSLPSDAVHIGGKTDIFVAGEVESASAQILGLTDEAPLARGYDAQTQGGDNLTEEFVLLPDIDTDFVPLVHPGMSLVLMEGSDVGAYRITQVLTGPTRVRLHTPMTGAQPNLTWKIVDEIDVDLVTPKDVLLEGSDLILSAGSPIVIAAGGINFAGAGIRPNDILFVDNLDYGGDFTIMEASATALYIDPPAPRALAGVHYVVSRRSEGVQRPVLRIKGLELLDSAGAPNGTSIPYRDPVLCTSKAFQNEGSGFLYDGPAFLGLVTVGFPPGEPPFAGMTIEWAVRDAARAYGATQAQGILQLTNQPSMAALANVVNFDPVLRSAGVRAVAIEYAGLHHLGFTSPKLVTITGGDALPAFGWEQGSTNAQVRGASSLSAVKVRRGDLIECVGGSNSGLGLRIIADPNASNAVVVGTGPLGPPGTNALYDNAPLNPDAGGRIRIARPSVGSARCYFLEPTSIDFDYATTRLSTTINGQERVYRPDPENTRILVPPPPNLDVGSAGTVYGSDGYFEDTAVDFLRYGIEEGDLLDVLYQPLVSTESFDPSIPIAVGGKTLILQLDTDPFIQVSFPYAMTLQDLVDYINEQVGETIAYAAGPLMFAANRRIEIVPSSTALGVLFLTTLHNDHSAKGTFIVRTVGRSTLHVAGATPFSPGTYPMTIYRIRRYLQRISSTEMNLQLDASGLYYADVEAVSVLPGDYNNIGADIELEMTGYRSDGYRLISKQPELSFSRAEDLRAELSRSILLVGASDNPMDYVQLNLQNVQVSYERSALADDIQSFVGSRYRRVICEDILIRHLLPHYVSLNWRYSGGSSEPDMTRALAEFLGKIEGGGELEVGALTDILRGKQATSVFAVDPNSPTGRTAPQLLVVKHEESRRVRASLVRDIVDTVRMCTYLPDNLLLKRLSSSGVR